MARATHGGPPARSSTQGASSRRSSMSTRRRSVDRAWPAPRDRRKTVLQPMRLPLLRNRWTAFLTRFLVAAQIRRQLRIVGVQRTLLIEANVTSPVVGILGEARSVYWAQDDWQGLAEIVGLNPRILERNERSLVRRSSAVVAANPLVADRLTRSRSDVRLIPFGASTSMFESESEDDARPTRRASSWGRSTLDRLHAAGRRRLRGGGAAACRADHRHRRGCRRGPTV